MRAAPFILKVAFVDLDILAKIFSNYSVLIVKVNCPSPWRLQRLMTLKVAEGN